MVGRSVSEPMGVFLEERNMASAADLTQNKIPARLSHANKHLDLEWVRVIAFLF